MLVLNGVLFLTRPGPGRAAVHHTKVLSGTKKERNQWVFFVVKGIIGQRYYDRTFGRVNQTN